MKKNLAMGIGVGLLLVAISIVARNVSFRGGIMDDKDIEKVQQYEKEQQPWYKRIASTILGKKPIRKSEQNIAGKIFYRVINETDESIEVETKVHKKFNIKSNSSADIIHLDKKKIYAKKPDGRWKSLKTDAHIIRIKKDEAGKLILIPTDSRGETHYTVYNELDIPIHAITGAEKETIDPKKSARVERGKKPWMKIETVNRKKESETTKTLNHFIRVKRDRKGKIKLKEKP